MSDLLTGARGEVYGPRAVRLTDDLTVLRVLPQRERRTVGAWCFLDRYRADEQGPSGALDVWPHPHIGLQTVTWLFSGEVRHRDSLGNDQHIRPGELNLMTAGAGISHAETSMPRGVLHGLQFWIALPDRERLRAASFEHHASLPVVDLGGALARILIGELRGKASPASAFSPLVGMEISATRSGVVRVPLEPSFEYALLSTGSALAVNGARVDDVKLLYLGSRRERVEIEMESGALAFLFGGEPLHEPVLLWWNFVARTHEEMIAARNAWEHSGRFGIVAGFGDRRVPAPPLTMRLRP
ncbi:pirin family protein [bacterium]|nr:MAG: pirin family protein [bacterium]